LCGLGDVNLLLDRDKYQLAMPTRKKATGRGTARLEFVRIPWPEGFHWHGVQRAIARLRRTYWTGGHTDEEMLLEIFDPKLRDLAELPLAALTVKPAWLPQSLVPVTQEELLRFSRRLIDRGEDQDYIDLMLLGWPAGDTLSTHVADLWALRAANGPLYELIVRSFHGDGLQCALSQQWTGQLSRAQFESMIVRQELLWCAQDLQITTARAGVATRRPFGKLLTTTMRVIKPGTVLRLMRAALAVLKLSAATFKTVKEGAADNEEELKGPIARPIHVFAKQKIESGNKSVAAYQIELEDSMPLIRMELDAIEARIDALEKFHSSPEALAASKSASNKFKFFHQIWYSDLTPAAGVMVSAIRMALAERHLARMVAKAATPTPDDPLLVREVAPLPGLPQDETERDTVLTRALDIAYGARRAILRDDDLNSRSKHVTADYRLNRDKDDKAGPFLEAAVKFLDAAGRRDAEAHLHPTADDRARTFFYMDVTPEARLRAWHNFAG